MEQISELSAAETCLLLLPSLCFSPWSISSHAMCSVGQTMTTAVLLPSTWNGHCSSMRVRSISVGLSATQNPSFTNAHVTTLAKEVPAQLSEENHSECHASYALKCRFSLSGPDNYHPLQPFKHRESAYPLYSPMAMKSGRSKQLLF